MQFTFMHIVTIIIKANNIFISYNETTRPVHFIVIVQEQETTKYNEFHHNAEQGKFPLHFPVL
jgi:hypothetical protein